MLRLPLILYHSAKYGDSIQFLSGVQSTYSLIGINMKVAYHSHDPGGACEGGEDEGGGGTRAHRSSCQAF